MRKPVETHGMYATPMQAFESHIKLLQLRSQSIDLEPWGREFKSRSGLLS